MFPIRTLLEYEVNNLIFSALVFNTLYTQVQIREQFRLILDFMTLFLSMMNFDTIIIALLFQQVPNYRSIYKKT